MNVVMQCATVNGEQVSRRQKSFIKLKTIVIYQGVTDGYEPIRCTMKGFK